MDVNLVVDYETCCVPRTGRVARPLTNIDASLLGISLVEVRVGGSLKQGRSPSY